MFLDFMNLMILSHKSYNLFFYFFLNFCYIRLLSFLALFSNLNFFSHTLTSVFKKILFFKKNTSRRPRVIFKNYTPVDSHQGQSTLHPFFDSFNLNRIYHTTKRVNKFKRLRPTPYPHLSTNFFLNFYRGLVTYSDFFNNDKFTLVGNLILPHSWEFENKKKWFRPLMLEDLISKYNKNVLDESPLLFYKNLYFNHYYFFNNLRLKFSDFKYFIKISNLKLKATNDDTYVYTKPYSFLTILNSEYSFFNPYVLFYHFVFKQYQKYGSSLVKNFKLLETNRILSKKYFFLHSFPFSIRIKGSLPLFELIDESNDKEKYFNFFSKLRIRSRKEKFVEYFLNQNSKSVFLKKKIRTSFTKNQIYLNFKNFLTRRPAIIFLFSNLFFIFKILKQKLDNVKYDPAPIYTFFANYYKNNHDFFTSSYFNFYYDHFKFVNEQAFDFNIKMVFKIRQLFLSFFNQNFYFFKNNIDDFFSNKETSSLLHNTYSGSLNLLEAYYPNSVYSKCEINLVLNLWGFLVIHNNSFLPMDVTFLAYNAKKKHFSFPLKNEMQKFLIRRYIKSSLTSYLFADDGIKKPTPHLALSNIIENERCDSLRFNLIFSNMGEVFEKFSTLKSFKWAAEAIEAEESDSSNFSFFIRKIKFKPGYMTFWREARAVFKEILNLNFKYQYKLTRYLIKFNKILKFNSFMNAEMSLENILIRSRFFFDWHTSLFFLTNGLIFVNGINCYNSKFQIYVGDFIQMIVHNKYYILYRWLSHWITKKKLKLKIKTKKKLTPIESEEDKIKTKIYPKWILTYRNIYEDSAKFLEIDFFTLSIFIIYEPLAWQDLNIYSTLWTRYSVINMYNWKYIN